MLKNHLFDSPVIIVNKLVFSTEKLHDPEAAAMLWKVV